MGPLLLRAARVITPDEELRDAWVAVEGERIVAVGAGTPPGGVQDTRPPYAVLVPGLIDLHNHGGGGAAFTEGAQAARRARDAHLREGTTTVVASLVTDTVETLVGQVAALRPLVEAGELGGIHLEGPWLAPRWCGAHPPELLTDPDPGAVAALADAADGTLVMVTLAPERDGALAATRALTGRGVRVAVGHTDAIYEQTRAAVRAGASVATHLYNGARPPHHREPGPSVALLEDPGVFVETIADGAHVHPAVVRATARAAGGRWLLVTDAMAAALLGDGSYLLGTLEVDVVDGLARLRGREALAGSTLSLVGAVRCAVRFGVPLLDAVHAASAAPAAAMGWTDVGRLGAGCLADLVALDEELNVAAVMRRGEWVDRTVTT